MVAYAKFPVSRLYFPAFKAAIGMYRRIIYDLQGSRNVFGVRCTVFSSI